MTTRKVKKVRVSDGKRGSPLHSEVEGDKEDGESGPVSELSRLVRKWGGEAGRAIRHDLQVENGRGRAQRAMATGNAAERPGMQPAIR